MFTENFLACGDQWEADQGWPQLTWYRLVGQLRFSHNKTSPGDITVMSNPFAKAGGGGGGGGPPAIPSRGTKSGEGESEEVVERTLIVKGECLVYRIPPQVLQQINVMKRMLQPVSEPSNYNYLQWNTLSTSVLTRVTPISHHKSTSRSTTPTHILHTDPVSLMTAHWHWWC